jgi:transglutaminase-like putative cysteine protease
LIDRLDEVVQGVLDGASGVRYWLSDSQACIGLGPDEWFSRNITEVSAPDGLQQAATCEIVFDPTFQQPLVHFVRVVRGGAVREITEGFEVFRRERDLERAKIDGRLTAHLAISDLRVGDIVDFAYSVVGSNPIYAGSVSAMLNFQWSVPVARTRFRLVTPEDRTVKDRQWNDPPVYSERRGDGLVDRCWVSERAAPMQLEPATPTSWIPHSRLFLSDAPDWAQVTRIYRDLFPRGEPLPADLEERLAPWRSLDEEARVANALRLVQSEVRYLAISIGVGGLKPRAPDQVWQSRFGDCKDVSQLLCTLLQRLDVDAVPALVNTVEGETLDAGPPALLLFDHCVIRVQCQGKIYWLDPTRSTQGGVLDKICQARFGWALPLKQPGGLEHMGQDEAQVVLSMREDFTLGAALNEPARLEVRCRHRAWRADQLRTALANNGQAKVEQDYADFYRQRYGDLQIASAMEFKDDVDNNEIETKETYLIERPWSLDDNGSRASFAVFDHVSPGAIPIGRSATRKAPIALGWPRKLTQKTVVNLPLDWNVSAIDRGWKVGPVAGSTRGDQPEPRTFVWRINSTIGDPVAPADLARRLADAADEMGQVSSIVLSNAVKKGRLAGASSRGGGVPFWFWWILGVVTFNLLLALGRGG